MKYKISGAVASAALMLTLLAPKAFATAGSGLDISNNGAGSDNTITVGSANTCDVTQKANTKVNAIVVASSETGGNTANGNTNGSVTVDTGNATSTATVDVKGGSNRAVNPCCCPNPAPTADPALISGNGEDSTNAITDVSTNNSDIYQKAKTKVRAAVVAKAKTGKNEAKNNTGPGSVLVKTGNAGGTAGLKVTGGTNNLP